MQVNGVNSNLAFGGAMKSFTSALDTAAEATGNISDLVSTASLALDTPEVATVKVLNDKLADVSKNEKVPNFVRKAVKYTCCAIATGLTFAVTRNVVRGQGKLIDLGKKFLEKFDLGKSALNLGSTIKENFKKMNLSEKLHLKGKFGFIKTGADKTMEFLGGLLDKTPKIKAGFTKIGDILKIKEWTTKDYVANIAATLLATKHATKAIKTPDKAVTPTVTTEILEPLTAENKETPDKVKEAA